MSAQYFTQEGLKKLQDELNQLKNVERPLIETVLGKAEGNQSAAAAMLGIDRNTLRKKIQQLRIKA